MLPGFLTELKQASNIAIQFNQNFIEPVSMFLHAPFIQNKLLWSLLPHKTKICTCIIYPILNMHRKGLTLHTYTWNVHHLLNCFRRLSISAVSWLFASSVLSIYSKTVTITSKKNTLQIWHYLFNWDNNIHVNTMYVSYLNINTNYVAHIKTYACTCICTYKLWFS